MKKIQIIFLTFSLLISGSINAQSPVLVEELSENKKAFYYNVADQYNHNYLKKTYEYISEQDSILLTEEQIYHSTALDETFHNGVSKLYNSKGETVLEHVYMYNKVYKSTTAEYGEDYYMGDKCLQIPLLELKDPDHKASNSKNRMFTEPYMFNQPSGKCFDFNSFDYSFSQQAECTDRTVWWLPNLLVSKDTAYSYSMGIEFEVEFTPQISERTYPYQFILGNSPSGFYYITIDKTGKTALGFKTNETDGYKDILYVSKATKITFGEENRIRIRLLGNGHFYIEINDYSQGETMLKVQNMDEDSDYEVELGSINGISNRLSVYGEMDISRIYLGMFQFVEEGKNLSPFNSMYRSDIKDLTDLFAEKLFQSTAEADILSKDLYLTSFMEKEEGEANELNLACNIEFDLDGDINHKTIWFKYYLDDETNAIKNVTAIVGSEKASWTASEFYDLVLKDSGLEGFAIEQEMISHSNSR